VVSDCIHQLVLRARLVPWLPVGRCSLWLTHVMWLPCSDSWVQVSDGGGKAKALTTSSTGVSVSAWPCSQTLLRAILTTAVEESACLSNGHQLVQSSAHNSIEFQDSYCMFGLDTMVVHECAVRIFIGLSCMLWYLTTLSPRGWTHAPPPPVFPQWTCLPRTLPEVSSQDESGVRSVDDFIH